MMKRVWLSLWVVCLPLTVMARGRVQGWCQDGNVSVTVPGTTGSGTQKFQRSYPSCTVTVYTPPGSTTLATLFADDAGTVRANPFTSAGSGQWFFYADDGRYDVRLSGGSIASPFTLGDQQLTDARRPGNIRYAAQFAGANIGAKINTAIADLPSTTVGGTIYLPEGVSNFSTQIVIDRPVTLVGMAAGFGSRGTVLTWTGGASAAIVMPNTVGVNFKNFTLSNTGTGTIGFDIDTGATEISLEDIFVLGNWSDSGIRIGQDLVASLVNTVHLRRVYVRDAVVGIKILAVVNVWMDHVFDTLNTNLALQIGDATHAAFAIYANECTFEGGAANLTAVQVLNVEAASFEQCYFEQDGTGYSLSIPSTATLAQAVSIAHSRLLGNAFGTASTYAVEVNLTTATLSVTDSFFKSYANPGYMVRNTASRSVVITGNNMNSAGSVVTDAFTRVLSLNNTDANVLQTPYIPQPSAPNSTPVTVSVNTTAAQNLMSYSIPARVMNVTDKVLRVAGYGVFTTVAAQTPTVTISIMIGSTVVWTVTSGATPASSTNFPWNISVLMSTVATGGAGTLEVHGNLTINDVAPSNGPARVYIDGNTAPSSAIDLTIANTLQVRVTFSTNTAPANSCTQRLMLTEVLN